MTANEKTEFLSYYSFFGTERLQHLHSTFATEIHLSDAEVIEYMRAGVFVRPKAQNPQPGFGMVMFFEPEVAKKRKRLIQHTKDINEQTMCPEAADPLFQSDEVRIREGLQGFGFCADAAWFYQQIPVDDERYYTFAHPRLGWLTLAAVATGQRHAVGAAQCISRFLNRKTTDLMRLTNPHYAGLSTEYIDNFRRRDACPQSASLTARCFFRVCKRYRVTLNESMMESLQAATTLAPYEFVGVRYSPAEGAAGLTAKTKAKIEQLKEDVTQLETGQQSWSMGFASSVFGLLIFASTITRLCTAKYYYTYKFFRRRHSENRGDSCDAEVWPCIYSELSAWCCELLEKQMVRWRDDVAVSVPIVITDASKSGYGATLFSEGKVTFFGAEWPPSTWVDNSTLNINELETLAILYGAQALGVKTFHLIVDNTTALFAVRKGRSKSYRVNIAVQRLEEAGLAILSTKYIHTSNMVSDRWSRLFE
jgi:hypothetical protein